MLDNLHPDRNLDAPYRLALLGALDRAAAAGADPYAFHVVMLDFLVETGWDARGGSFASGVPEDAWETFDADHAAAALHGHAAWLLHPNLPLAPTGMIRVAKAHEDSLGPAEWFGKAVAVQVDAPAAWHALREALHPKWGGSFEAQLRLARAGLRAPLRGTLAPKIGMQIAFGVRGEWDEERDVEGRPPEARRAMWRKTREALVESLLHSPPPEEELIASPADWEWALWVGSLAREMAEEGRDDDRLALLRLWPPADREPLQLRAVLDGYRRDYVAGPLAAARGPAAAEAAALVAALDPETPAIAGGEVPALRAAAGAVRAAAADDPVQLGWLEDVTAVLDRAEALAAGETWTPSFRPGLPGWRCRAGKYRIVPREELAKGAVGSGNGIELAGETDLTIPYLSPLGRLPEPLFAAARVEPFNPSTNPDVWQAPAVGVGLGPGVMADLNPDIASVPVPDPLPKSSWGGYHFYERRSKTYAGAAGWWPVYRGGPRLAFSNRRYGVVPIWKGGVRVDLGVLAEPGRAATFRNRKFVFEAGRHAPAAVHPVRFGAQNQRRGRGRLVLDSVRIAHCPDFQPPPRLGLEGFAPPPRSSDVAPKDAAPEDAADGS